jgi:MFS transporter, DHA3 family, macrolide efflux protein
MKEYKDLVKNNDFMRLWISQFFSQIAVQTMNFLIIIKVFESTGSTIASSFVWIIFIIPAILIGPFAAAYVDFTDRKRVLANTNLAQMIVILVYALSHEEFLYLSYGVVFLYSLFNQFYVPAEISSLPLLVSEKKLPFANSLFLISYQVAMFVGFGLTGFITSLFGFRVAFFATGALMFIAYLSVAGLPNMRIREKKLTSFEHELGDFFGKIVEGYLFIKNNTKVLISFLTLVAMQVGLAIATVNLPLFTTDVLGISAKLSGMVIIPAGIGAAIGVITSAKRLSEAKNRELVVKTALVFIAIVLWTLALPTPLIPFPYRYIVVFFLAALLGGAYIGVHIPTQTTMQVETPHALMARVFGNIWFITTIATVFPLVFSATISEVFGSRTLFTLLGAGVFALAYIHGKYVKTSNRS